MIPVWRSYGYPVKLIFLSLPNVEIALERVAIGVQQGGHNVLEDVVRRRLVQGVGRTLQNYCRFDLEME